MPKPGSLAAFVPTVHAIVPVECLASVEGAQDMIGLSMASTQIEGLITFCSSYGEVFGVIFGSLPSVPRTSKFN